MFCIGTAQFGMDYGIANIVGQPKQEEINRIVSYAIENGIYFFDTAQSYGYSEQVLGEAIDKLKDKNSLRIVSKLSPDLYDYNSEIIIKAAELSVQKLNVNSLYGFLAHRLEDIHKESFSLAIEKLKEDKLIFKSGVSVYSPDEAMVALDNPLVEILQIPFNILDRRWIDEGVLEKAQKKNVQLFFRSIFLQGLLFLTNRDLEKCQMDWAKPYLRRFNELVAETDMMPIELSFEILSNIPGDNVVIIGIDNFTQIQKNIKHIQNVKTDISISEKWWDNLPIFPEKLLNPTLWD